MIHKSSKIKACRGGRFRGPDTAQVRIRIERSLKLLSIDLPILVNDMRIDFRQHLCLCMAGIALGRFEVTMI